MGPDLQWEDLVLYFKYLELNLKVQGEKRAAILKVRRQIENPTPLIDAHLYLTNIPAKVQ